MRHFYFIDDSVILVYILRGKHKSMLLANIFYDKILYISFYISGEP